MVVDDKAEGYAVVPGGIRGLEVRAVERTLSDALRRLVAGHTAKVIKRCQLLLRSSWMMS